MHSQGAPALVEHEAEEGAELAAAVEEEGDAHYGVEDGQGTRAVHGRVDVSVP